MPDETAPLEPPEDVPAVSAERLVDGRLREDGGADDAADEPEVDAAPRRYPSTIGGAFYLVMLAVSALGLGLVVVGDWRTGVRLVGGSLVFGSVVRLVLPSRDAGMLAVRSKLLDALLLSAVGVAIFVLVGAIPDQPR